MSIENLIKELADSYALIVKDKNSALRSIECVNSPKLPIVEESKLAVDNVSRNIRHSIEAMFHRHGVSQLEQEVKELREQNKELKTYTEKQSYLLDRVLEDGNELHEFIYLSDAANHKLLAASFDKLLDDIENLEVIKLNKESK